MRHNRKAAAVAVVGLGVLGTSAMGSLTTVVVTSPAEVLIQTVDTPLNYTPASGQPNSILLNDPFVFDAWTRRNLANHGAVGLTSNYARSGNGSAWLWGPSFNGNTPSKITSKADMEYYYSDTTGKTLGNLTSLSYDWYRSSTSTANAWFAPVLRLKYDADGDTNTIHDQGYLVYERAEQPAFGLGAAPTDSWTTDNAFSNLFWRIEDISLTNPFNATHGYAGSHTLADWQTSTYTSSGGYAQLTSSSLILGVNTGIGRGWGPFYGAVDNITIGFGGADTRWNFEVPSDTVAANTAAVGSGAGAVEATFTSATGELTVTQGFATNTDLADPNNPFAVGAAANFAAPNSSGTYQLWDVSLLGGTYTGPIELTFTYNDAGIANEAGLVMYHFTGGSWVALSGTVDTVANTITVISPSLSPFALGGDIPEPTSLALLSAGSLLLLRRRRSV